MGPGRPRCSHGSMGRLPVGLPASSSRRPTGRNGLTNGPSLLPRCQIGLLFGIFVVILFAPCRRTSTSGSETVLGRTNFVCGVIGLTPWPRMQVSRSDLSQGIVQILRSTYFLPSDLKAGVLRMMEKYPDVKLNRITWPDTLFSKWLTDRAFSLKTYMDHL